MEENESTGRFRPLKPSLARETDRLINNWNSGASDLESETLFHALIGDAVDAPASDVHLDPEEDGFCLRMRVDGALHDVHLMPPTLGERVLNHFKVMAQLDPVPAKTPMEGWIDYNIEGQHINLRVSCVPSVVGDKLSIRLLDSERVKATIASLGLGDDQADLIQSWAKDIRGMFLVVGAVGSGKTTTLYTLLEGLRKRDRSIVTIEDPVEYRLEGITQLQVSPRHSFDFASGLKSILRIDPDYIMLGEIRDCASADASVDAASTGKILMSTLHSRDAVGAVTALRNYGIEDYEIAAILELIVAQRLVRKLCRACRQEEKTRSIDRKWLESFGREVPETAYYAKGCEKCGGVGYRGRTGIFEVWRLNESDKAYLLDRPDEQTLRQAIRSRGVASLFDSAWSLIQSGETSLEELRTVGGF